MVDLKQQALATHRFPISSISDLIEDDPTGFHLSSEILANFDRPGEMYLERDRAMRSIDIQNGMMNEMNELVSSFKRSRPNTYAAAPLVNKIPV